MEQDDNKTENNFSNELTEAMIRFGLIAFLVYTSAKIFSPFMGMMMWGLILAVTLYPLHQKIADKIGGKQGAAATFMVLAGLLLIGIPATMLGESTADFARESVGTFQKQSIEIKPPPASVAEWPVVGDKIHAAWTLAANDLPTFIEDNKELFTGMAEKGLSVAAGMVGGLFQFLFSFIIAGVMMAYGQSGSQAMLKIIERLAGKKNGDYLHNLSTATVRSVSMGVIGVAAIQALILGIGFIWADIPAAGLLAIAVLVLGIAQVPAALITIPVIAYLWWSGDSTISNVLFTIYFVIGGLADGVLKPMLLGRGVDAPMPIILLGALGGMVAAGMIGLFTGAVLFALAYVIFMDWVDNGELGDGLPDPADTPSDNA
ncbi:MAG: AI-2E family transporter [Pseudomonadales bacterium]|nr:AI-2E family transporter [Pseudomonadales bacterium]